MSNEQQPADEKARQELIDELSAAVPELQAATEAVDDAVALRMGINRTDLRCLDIVYRHGPLTAGQLAEETALTPGAITAALDRLERSGYARRLRDDADRRRVVVETTERTRDMVAKFYEPIAREGRDRLFSRLSIAELTVIRDYLRMGRELQHEHAAHIAAAGGPAAARGADLAGQLASLSEAHLHFTHGGARIELRSADHLQALYEAHFEGQSPSITVDQGDLTIDYRGRFRPFDWSRHSALVTLNAALPWSIDLRGGASRLTADLRGLQLIAFEMTGGAGDIEVFLPHPAGTVQVRIAGGANKVTLHRPGSVPVSAQLAGGASRLTFDDAQSGGFGGLTRLQSPEYASSDDRYDIRFTGGASKVTIDTIAD